MPFDQKSTSTGEAFPPLVFIPGRKGSGLSDPEGRCVWLNGLQALGLTTPDLRLPVHWENDVQKRDELRPTEPLRKVLTKDIYAPFLDWAKASGRSLHAFAYDWRRDNLENTGKFVEFLQTVSEQHEGAKIQLVGHSMGGLISFVGLKRRPDLVHSALFAGVPFGPMISFLEDMHAGVPTGLNRRILSPQVMFTFVSVYCLFPTDEYESALCDQQGKPIQNDWYSPGDWERRKLGIFATLERADVSEAERIHLRNALARAQEFRSQICSKEDSFEYPPFAVLAG